MAKNANAPPPTKRSKENGSRESVYRRSVGVRPTETKRQSSYRMTGRLTNAPARAATLSRTKKASVGAVKTTRPTGRMRTASTRSTTRNETTVPPAKASTEMRRRRRSSSRCSINVIDRSSTSNSFKRQRRLDAARATPNLPQAPRSAPLLWSGLFDLALRVSHCAPELPDRPAQRSPDPGQPGGTEDQQRDDKDDHQLR